jgi:hypothetical protein
MRGRVSDQELFHELMFYTLAHPDPAFIHQHAVDAFAAQHGSENAKPITNVFALVGLFLHLEKNFTGRQVQRAHMLLARRRKSWPKLKVPAECAQLTVGDIVASEPGVERDALIHRWCASVWSTWISVHPEIARIVRDELDIA